LIVAWLAVVSCQGSGCAAKLRRSNHVISVLTVPVIHSLDQRRMTHSQNGAIMFQTRGYVWLTYAGDQLWAAESQPSLWHKREAGAYCSSVRSCAGPCTHPLHLFIEPSYTYRNNLRVGSGFSQTAFLFTFPSFVASRRSVNGLSRVSFLFYPFSISSALVIL
jgi:hypothetical protein